MSVTLKLADGLKWQKAVHFAKDLDKIKFETLRDDYLSDCVKKAIADVEQFVLKDEKATEWLAARPCRFEHSHDQTWSGMDALFAGHVAFMLTLRITTRLEFDRDEDAIEFRLTFPDVVVVE
ncbi:hypothetical protein ACFODL_15455 [Phenylobacterium terrae]|uniref:Uncharacterized protein n=1 Tax=Phenylobacterium terrae TaxID=2665495 RepID=A0ABW4N6K1_9CAUL